MNRRQFVPGCLIAGALALPVAAAPTPRARLPERASIKVAFLLGADTNVIDTAGPWEVFQDVMVMRTGMRASADRADMTMSVCTGAYQLARAGLLDGLNATTHHDFWDDFAKEFPKVHLQRGARFVDNGRIATSGGLTSGVDLALHVVARYLGDDAAAATAKYMEWGQTPIPSKRGQT